MRGTRFTRLAAAALLVWTAACESATDPAEKPTFDAEAALADYQALEGVLSSGGLKSFTELGERNSFDVFGQAPMGVESAAGAPIISDRNRGNTFVYDPETGDYALDPDRTDAPSTGVRWVLYEKDAAGNPDPSAEIGHVDLIDEGDGSAEDIVLRLVVTENGLTVLDYRTSLDQEDESGAITVDGFLQSPEDRLDFAIDVAGSENSEGSSVDVGFEMGIDTRDFLVQGNVKGREGTDEAGEIDVSVRHGQESIGVDAVGTETTLDATFTVNDEVFATATGDPDEPTFVGATGEPLTLVEVVVLHHIVHVVDDVFDLFEELMEPVGHLVLLGVVL